MSLDDILYVHLICIGKFLKGAGLDHTVSASQRYLVAAWSNVNKLGFG